MWQEQGARWRFSGRPAVTPGWGYNSGHLAGRRADLGSDGVPRRRALNLIYEIIPDHLISTPRYLRVSIRSRPPPHLPSLFFLFAIALIAALDVLPQHPPAASHSLASTHLAMASSTESATLHPPRLAAMFAGTPSAPGTPVHSIQTMRRKAAGHSGPLTKILVANRGVCAAFLVLFVSICTLGLMVCGAFAGNCYSCFPYCT